MHTLSNFPPYKLSTKPDFVKGVAGAGPTFFEGQDPISVTAGGGQVAQAGGPRVSHCASHDSAMMNAPSPSLPPQKKEKKWMDVVGEWDSD